MHVGMVTINGEKMSKSLGNIKSIKHVLDNWGSNIIRLFCLSGHYSKPIDYSEELLKLFKEVMVHDTTFIERLKKHYAMFKSSKKKKIGRNEHCPCGSGKKYKKCCLDKDTGGLCS